MRWWRTVTKAKRPTTLPKEQAPHLNRKQRRRFAAQAGKVIRKWRQANG